jgi:hypothetical protein
MVAHGKVKSIPDRGRIPHSAALAPRIACVAVDAVVGKLFDFCRPPGGTPVEKQAGMRWLGLASRHCRSGICQMIMQMLICTQACTLKGALDPTCPTAACAT